MFDAEVSVVLRDEGNKAQRNLDSGGGGMLTKQRRAG